MREQLIRELAEGWRQAENHFLETHDDCKKLEMKEKTDDAKLTDAELKELYATLQQWGV